MPSWKGASAGSGSRSHDTVSSSTRPRYQPWTRSIAASASWRSSPTSPGDERKMRTLGTPSSPTALLPPRQLAASTLPDRNRGRYRRAGGSAGRHSRTGLEVRLGGSTWTAPLPWSAEATAAKPTARAIRKPLHARLPKGHWLSTPTQEGRHPCRVRPAGGQVSVETLHELARATTQREGCVAELTMGQLDR